MKEAYIKAVGIGLGMEDLTRAKFIYTNVGPRGRDDADDAATMDLELDGTLRSDWSFRMVDLDETHMACVALGPHADAVRAPRPPAVAEPGASGTAPVALETLRFADLVIPKAAEPPSAPSEQ